MRPCGSMLTRVKRERKQFDCARLFLFLFSLQKLLSSLLDSVDKGYQEEVPDLLSSLPGLKRSAYLASQAQLDNLVQRPCHKTDQERIRTGG